MQPLLFEVIALTRRVMGHDHVGRIRARHEPYAVNWGLHGFTVFIDARMQQGRVSRLHVAENGRG